MRAVRVLSLTVAVGLALLMWWGGHHYLFDRLVVKTALPQPWALGFAVAIGLVAAGSLLLLPLAERLLAPPWCRLAGWPAASWLGMAFLLLVLLATSDLLLLLGSWLWALDAEALALQRGRAVLVVAFALVAFVAGVRVALRPRVHRVRIGLERWPAALDGMKVVQISDVHIGPILGRRFAAWITTQVNALAPDLVVVTGDLVDGRVSRLRDEVAPFADLRALHGVYFVTGNHDHYSSADEWCAVAQELGMQVLRNRWHRLELRGTSIAVTGVDDHRGHWLGGQREDLDAALAGIPVDMPVLLLAHDPTTFRAASQRVIDLQISGHTHGGQIWPFSYVVRLVVPYLAGLYRQGRAQLWVSRGTGFWGPPLRLGAPPEITELTLFSVR